MSLICIDRDGVIQTRNRVTFSAHPPTWPIGTWVINDIAWNVLHCGWKRGGLFLFPLPRTRLLAPRIMWVIRNPFGIWLEHPASPAVGLKPMLLDELWKRFPLIHWLLLWWLILAIFLLFTKHPPHLHMRIGTLPFCRAEENEMHYESVWNCSLRGLGGGLQILAHTLFAQEEVPSMNSKGWPWNQTVFSEGEHLR